jgi:predicted O-methyltransferase YrrM
MPDLEYFAFCPTLKTILQSGHTVGSTGAKIKVHSFSTLNNLRVLREIIKEKKPTRTLEIGLAYGGSALTILATLKEVVQKDYIHTAIDPFQERSWNSAAIIAIERAGLNNFRFIEGFSSLVLPAMLKQSESFDLIYIDGSHSFENVFVDHYFSIRLLSAGGILLFDDCTTKDVAKVIGFIRRQQGHACKPIDLSRYDDPRKAFTKRIANALGIRQLKGFCKNDSAGIML